MLRDPQIGHPRVLRGQNIARMFMFYSKANECSCFQQLGTGKLTGANEAGLYTRDCIGPGFVLFEPRKEHRVLFILLPSSGECLFCATPNIRRASERKYAEHTLPQACQWSLENICCNFILCLL